LKINVGCGRHVLDGWTNVDVQRSPLAKRDPEILCDAREIPLPDECADEMQAIHLWEHFYLWECDALLAEWRRLLKPGGKLVLELPNLVKCAQNIVDDRMKGSNGLPCRRPKLGSCYADGDPREKDPYMCHRWAWSPKTLRRFLEERGFRDVKEHPTQWHPAGRQHRDMRIEAYKA